MSSKDYAETLRELADAMETADVSTVRRGWPEGLPPYVSIDVSDEAAAKTLAEAMGITSPPRYHPTLREMVIDLDSEQRRGQIKYRPVTIPRACQYCDQKHDCTHVEEVQA